MAIKFTAHARLRCKERNFGLGMVKKIVQTPLESYFDTQTQKQVAIGYRNHRTRTAKIGVFFMYEGTDVKIITVHAESDREIKKRISKGRYKII